MIPVGRGLLRFDLLLATQTFASWNQVVALPASNRPASMSRLTEFSGRIDCKLRVSGRVRSAERAPPTLFLRDHPIYLTSFGLLSGHRHRRRMLCPGLISNINANVHVRC